MNKTTERGGFSNQKNIRLMEEKSFNNKKGKIKYKAIPLFINLSIKDKKAYNVISLTTRNKNKNKLNHIKLFSPKYNDKFSKTATNFNKHKKKLFEENLIKLSKENTNISIYDSSNKKRNKTINSSQKRKYKLYNSIRNTAPDFKKIMSREQIDKIKNGKFFKIPFIVPNFSLVRERPLAMAIYKKFAKVIKDHSPKSKKWKELILKFNLTQINILLDAIII